MAQEVLLWCLASSGLVGLILLRDLKHLRQDWCCPAWFQSQGSDTADFAAVPITLQEQGVCGGRSVLGAQRVLV